MTECPHCGAEGYAGLGPGTPRVCLECGYDDEHGALGVCPGGKHPTRGKRAGGLCCDACYERVPVDLPGLPRWRSMRRAARADLRRPGARLAAHGTIRAVEDAVGEWLAAHPAEPS